MKYNAFISYKHAPLDIEVAKRIHSGLETFKIPGAIQKKYGIKDIKRVFRDQEELPIGSDLGNNISQALSESEYLIVICSPNTPGSYWVCKEIETFISMHDREHILAVLVEGEPDQSFPPMLLTDDEGNAVEPLAADLRAGSPKELKSKLKTELLRLAAPLIGCSYDDLRQRHRERRIKKLCTILCSAFFLTTVLGVGFAIYNANMAARIDKNYKKAVQNQYKYMADMAKGLLDDGYRKDAVLVGLEALSDETTDDTYVPAAEYLLSEALHTYDSGNDVKKDDMLEHQVPVDELDFDTDRCHLITWDRNNTVYLWEVKDTNTLITSVKSIDDESGKAEEIVKADHIGDELILCTENGVRGYSLSGEKVWSVDKKYCNTAIINAKNNLVILESTDEITVVDIATHKLIKTYDRPSEDVNYSFKLQYDEEKGRIFSSCSSADDKAYLARIDTNTDKVALYDVTKGYIPAITFSEDDYAFVVSIDDKELLKDITKPYTSYLQKINLTTAKEEWCYSTDFVEGGLNSSSSTMLKYRYYEDESKVMHKEAILAANSKAVCIDTDTGLALSEVNMPGAIRSIPIAKSGPLGYAALSTGSIEILNYPSGTIMSEFRIETDLNITDLKVADGVFAIKAYSSPDVLLMKYHVGQGMETLLSADDDIADVKESADGKYLAVITGFGYVDKLYFINKENEAKRLDLSFSSNDRITSSYFTDDNKLYVCSYEGKSYLIDPDTLEKEAADIESEESLELPEDIEPVDSLTNQTQAVSADGAYAAVACKDGKVKVINIKEGTVKNEIEYSGYSNSYIGFSEDGSKLILQGDDYYIFIYDVESGEKLYSSQEQYNRVKFIQELNNNRLAIITTMETLVLETDTYMPIAMINEGCFITKDGKVLTKHYGDLYAFPFQSIKSLKEAAAAQFGSQELSEEKRSKYHLIDIE